MKAVLAALAALVVAAPAAAAEIKKVDTSGYPGLAVTVRSDSPAAPKLTENGSPVAGLEAQNLGRAKTIVFALDRSRSMAGKALDDAVAAIRAFARAKAPADRVAVVGFGSQAVKLTTGFSSSTIDADVALRDVAVDPRQGTALNDAVALSARLLAGEDGAARVLVLVTDGRDVSSTTSAADAAGVAKRNGVAVYAVGIESKQFSPETLEQLAAETGGAYRAASSSGQLAAAYRSIAVELGKTWRLSYVTAARPGERLQLKVPGDEATAAMPGVRKVTEASKPALLPEPAYESGFGSLVVGMAVGLLLLLSFVLFARAKRATWLKDRLSAHVVEARAIAKARQSGERFPAGAGLLRATEQAFSHLNWWKKVHRQLERADVPLRTAEFFWICVACSFGLALIAAVTARSSLFILGAFLVGAAVPWLWLKLKAARRLKAFENQLPDLLLTMAASLKAGHSFKQGLQTVVDEGQPPASKEFTRVLAEARLGRPMEDALNEMADRVGSKNLRFVITCVTIQGQVGGSLAGLFDMVAETVRQRQQFARKIRGLTAMGRASAYVLVGLPFVTAGLITVINPEFMDPLYHTPTGHTLIFIGLGMIAFGSLILRKIVSFRG